MSFLPSWWSQGVQGQNPNGGFGTANMFNGPTSQQQGNFGGIGKKMSALADMLRSGGPQNTNITGNAMQPQSNEAMDNQQSDQNQTQMQNNPLMGLPTGQPAPSGQYMNPMQQGPNMGQVNNPNTMSPNGQVMPNWNRKYGGFNGSNQ